VTGRWGRSCRGAQEQGRRRDAASVTGRDSGDGREHRGRWVFGTDGDGGGCVSARLRLGLGGALCVLEEARADSNTPAAACCALRPKMSSCKICIRIYTRSMV
jgi:hypothetical protein